MATLPNATTTVDDQAGAAANVPEYAVVIGCVATNADITPRVYTSVKGLLAQHDYAKAVSYCSHHIKDTKKPVIFIGLPIATAGVAGQFDSTGVTGTCKISVSAASSGYMDQVDGELTVVTGGTIGTDSIVVDLSCDGGRNKKRIKLGTNLTYTIPNLGIVLTFGGGTLVAGDVFTWRTTEPMWDSDGLAAAKTALAAQQKASRSWMVIGDLPDSDFAADVVSAVNAYETEDKRFIYARCSVKDRGPLAKMSRVQVKMTAASVTFAEVGATGDTITRDTGSFVTDGFVPNMLIDVSGSVSNNFTKAKITAVSATVLTLDTQDLVAEGPVAGVTITGSNAVTFAEVGSTGDTITRSGGSFVDDGFVAGCHITVTGTTLNNFTSAKVTTVTATVLTLDTQDLAAEVCGSKDITIEDVTTMAAYVSTMDAAFATIASENRIDISLGRARKADAITGWAMRRPAAWPMSVREYQHDVQIPNWRKIDGPLSGWDMTDEDGQIVEYDERTPGGALAAGFSCLRTWGNGPVGAFGALSLTRGDEASLLSRTHNMAVANVMCSIVQAETEYMIGLTPRLNSDGTIFEADLRKLENRVNTKLQIVLLGSGQEGARASNATWTANRDDVFTAPGATLHGVGALEENGTIENVETSVRVDTAG